MMKTPEQTDIEWIKNCLERLEKKVDSLESFKWRVVGALSLMALAMEVILRR